MSDLLDRVTAKLAEDPDVTRPVLQALVGDRPDDPAALIRSARQINAARLQVLWDEFAAAALRTPAVIDRLPSVTTRQGVQGLRKRGTLLGLVRRTETYYPAWQFGPSGLRHDLSRILAALGDFSSDVIATDRIMRLPRRELGGRSIDDALDDAQQAEPAWHILQALGDPR